MPDAAMAPASAVGPWLVLDTATALTQVGLWQAGEWRACQTREALALEALPGLTEAVMASANITRSEVKAVVFNAGPGSILGLRVALMFATGFARASFPSSPLPLGVYHGLKLHALQPDFSGTLIMPFRRDLDNTAHRDGVNAVQLGLHPREEIARLPSPLTFVPLRSQDVPPPEADTTQRHDLQALSTALPAWTALVQWPHSPEVYVPQRADFKKWAAIPHRKS